MKRYRLPRELYKCGRSPGGKSCDSGPVKGKCSARSTGSPNENCTPLRTLNWWSNAIQIGFTLSALILISIACSNIGIKQIAAPGPLASPHAQLLVSSQKAGQENLIDDSNRCAACHPGMNSENKGVIGDSLGHVTQSMLCMKCHERTMPDAIHGSPHDLTGGALEDLVSRYTPSSSQTKLVSYLNRAPVRWQERPTECSQCHREHQGGAHSLQKIASDRCQACHREQFDSFSHGHPEFKNYPYERTSHIEFNHLKHRDLHFSKKGASFDCKTCHVQSEQAGVVGQVLRSVSFETACASCHSAPVKTAMQEGLIVLQIPSLNRKELLSKGVDIGVWPEQASLLNDGLIPPVMRWLIESETGGDEVLSRLPESGRLSDIDLNDSGQREALLQLTQVTKQLMKRIANEGQPAFRSTAQRLISVHHTASPLLTKEGASPWLDRFAGGIPPDLFRAALVEWFDEKSQSRSFVRQPSSRNSTKFASRSAQQDDLLAGESDLLGPDSSALLVPDANESKGNIGSFKDARAWDQLEYGGWMIDRQKMAIVYIPRGHADPWISQWVEFEEMRGDGLSVQSNSALARLAITSQCRQCHNTSMAFHDKPMQVSKVASFNRPLVSYRGPDASDGNDPLQECWRAKRRPSKLPRITKFDHAPHLALPTISDCKSCHLLASRPDETQSRMDDLHENHQEFVPMQRSQCANCHQSNAAGESCTQCHDYHVGNKAWHD